MKQCRNTEEIGKYEGELAHRCREEHCIPILFGFHGGAKSENVLFKKTPERTVDFSYIQIQIGAFYPASVLTFFPIPWASLTSEGSKKKLR